MRRSLACRLAATIAAAGIAAPALAADPASAQLPPAYAGDTLACRDEVTGTVCQVWLNPDGTYFAMFDRGPTAAVPLVGGIFRLEGREGRYTLRSDATGSAVCLSPTKVAGKTFEVERDDAIFGGAGCYPFTPGEEGASWTGRDRKGRAVRFWLIKGRG